MIRRFILSAAMAAMLVLLLASASLAAPEKLTGEEKSTTELIELSKPIENFSTFSKTCIVSGIADEGVKLFIYIKKDNQDTYEKLSVDGEAVSWTVGASGIFVKEIGLERNKVNKLIIYAEKDNNVQIIKRNITVKSLTIKQILKNDVVKIGDIITDILNN